GVDHRNGIAVGIGKTGAHRGLMTKIAGERHNLHPRIAGRDLLQNLLGTVFAPIVYKNHLQSKSIVFERLANTVVGSLDYCFLIITGYHYTQQEVFPANSVAHGAAPRATAN